MKLHRTNQSRRAFTLVELLAVVATLVVIAAIILPAIAKSQHRAPRISCVNNLKEIDLTYRIWAGDNEGKYPFEISVTNGGVMELTQNGNSSWLNYLVMSNMLNTPYILYCPADSERTRATTFSTNFWENISYFVGLDANTNSPQAMLCGDDNFEISGVPVKSGLLEVTTNTPITWSAARHHFAGNIGLVDGSVQQLSQSGLRQTIADTGLATNRLAIP